MDSYKNIHPSFLGIGAARSGTTWIDRQLRRSTAVWMPRRKELHYFTRSLKYPSSSHLADSSLFKRIFSLKEHNVRFKRELIKAFGRDLLYLDIDQLKWDTRYFLGTYSNDWYLSLFANHSNLITGEITPAYSLLDEMDLNILANLLPELKLIFIMRNPIDRAWSTIRYHEKREKRKLTKMSDSEIIEYLDRDAITSRSNYIEIIDKWNKYYSSSQIFIAYYDEIIEAPKDLLDRLCSFLNIDQISYNLKDGSKRINESIEAEMPDSIRRVLSEKYKTQIRVLSEKYAGYTLNWMKQLE